MSTRHLPLLVFILALLSCAEDFAPDNPLDPENPTYIPPEVTITSGPTEGTTLATPTATFTWEGNEPAMLYRTRFDSLNWSGWLSATTKTFDYLDEDDHVFNLQAKYTTGDTSDVISVIFTVDAVQGPALMFYPRRHIATNGSVVNFQIMAEEVFTLTATEFSVEFDPTSLQVISITEGSIFSDAGESIFFSEYDNQQGTITISAGLWGGENPTVYGTDDVAVLEVQVIQQGEAMLSFDGTETFRDPENNTITIQQSVNGLVVTQ